MYYATFDNRKLNNFTLEEWETLPFKNIKTISFDNNQLTKLPHLNKLINLMIKNKSFSSLRCFTEVEKSPYKITSSNLEKNDIDGILIEFPLLITKFLGKIIVQ